MGSVKIRLTVPGLPTFSGKLPGYYFCFRQGSRYPASSYHSGRNLTEGIRQTKSPCNLISNLDGKIVNMVIRNGTPLVKTGDICKQGDILVSGEVPILNDSQEVVRVEYVPADADIYVRHQIAYYQEVPLSYEKKVQSGTSKTSWYFRVGDFVFGADTGKKSRYITSTEEIPWKLTENFVLPFPWKNHPNTL